MNVYSYTGKNNKYTIKLNLPRYYKSCFCDCGMFMKDGVCMHLVGFSWVFEKYFYENYQNNPKIFATNKKKGRPKKCAKAGEFN